MICCFSCLTALLLRTFCSNYCLFIALFFWFLLSEHSVKTHPVHHLTEHESEEGGTETILEPLEATVAERFETTTAPTTSTTTTNPATTTTVTTTSTPSEPTTTTTQSKPLFERPAPTIVLVLDNSNNNSRPSLHRAGTSLQWERSVFSCV